jgi:hypothetical protein
VFTGSVNAFFEMLALSVLSKHLALPRRVTTGGETASYRLGQLRVRHSGF